MAEEAVTGQDHARNRLLAARDSIRRERGEVMAAIGRVLHAWRERKGLRFAESLRLSLAGPWFADLSRVRADEPLLPVLADLILEDAGGIGDDAAVLARLSAVLADAPALIILDNCEHLIASAATTVTRILS